MKGRILIFIAFPFLLTSAASAKTVIPFEGSMGLLSTQFHMHLYQSKDAQVDLGVQRISEKRYQILLDIKNFKTPFFLISSEIKSELQLAEPAEGSDVMARGHLESHYTLIDHKPASELSCTYEIRNKTLYVTSLAMGHIGGSGSVDLTEPYKMDFAVQLASVGMNDFLHFWVQDFIYESSGQVYGTIKAQGTPTRLSLVGNLEGYKGFVDKLDFDSIHLNIEGIYPRMTITPSTVVSADGMMLTFKGNVDLSDTQYFENQIRKLKLSPVVKETTLQKEWTFKRLREYDAAGKTELKYLLRKDDPGEFSTEKEHDMFGIERSLEF